MESKTAITDNLAADAHIIEPGSMPEAAAEDIATACYENEVPAFVEPELERLYGNVFSSLVHFRTYGGVPENTSTYTVRKNGRIIDIFLFRRERGKVQVINEGMALDEKRISRFADYIFGAYPSVGVIAFHAVPVEIRKFPFPYQQFTCTEDIVLTLPESADAYLASLGKNTRRNIKRYMDKLKRSFPSFLFDFYEGDVADEQQMRAIIGFNRARITGKNKAFAIDGEEVERVIALTRACGLVGVATIDGRVCGGTMGWLVGGNYFFKIISHDPQYNDYSTGILCCYLTICECIARGCRQYNFMQDGYDYKFALGAVARKLEHLAIYRSHAHLLLNGRTALKIAVDDSVRKARLALLGKAGKQEGVAGRLAFRLANLVRSVKRSMSAVSGR